jgi:N-acetylglutamate synthase-like GNAT family acetyltransferase
MKNLIDYTISGVLQPVELGELLDAVFSDNFTTSELSSIIHGSTDYVTARRGAELVGFGRLLSDGGTMAYINYMAVAPEYQRQGIGQQVLKLLVEAAGAVHSIFLYTNTADSLYLRNGFQPSEKRLYVMHNPARGK